MNFFEDIWKLHHDWCYTNPCILYGLVRSLKPKVIVECGTYRGFSASWMAKALQENGPMPDGQMGHLYCIDNFSLRDHEGRHGDARTHLESNLNAVGVRDVITILDGDSDKVTWPEKVDFAYIDGWHSYLATRHDFLECAQRGAECICLDDATQSVGPRMFSKFVRDLLPNWDVINILRDCGMAICVEKDRHRMGPITFSQELRNHNGVDLQTLTRQEQLAHLQEASRINGANYDSILPSLCEGRKG